MELRQLEHFVAVAEERSFTRAARRSNIVQSGLSMSMRALEEEVGTKLFKRSVRGVVLTPAGEAMLPEARRAIAAVTSARVAVDATQGLLRGCRWSRRDSGSRSSRGSRHGSPPDSSTFR